MNLAQIFATIYSLWINISCWKAEPVCKYWSVVLHKENQCMMGTDPDLQTIFHIYALMSLCFAHIRLYFEINRHTADYRLLTVCCEVLFMTNYVKRMMPHCFWALQTTSLWVQGNRILRKELNIAQQQKKQIIKGKWEKTFRMERVADVKVMLVCMRCWLGH